MGLSKQAWAGQNRPNIGMILAARFRQSAAWFRFQVTSEPLFSSCPQERSSWQKITTLKPLI